MKVLSINQFAQIVRTTPRTIRFYEEMGLFKPAKVDEWTKYRYYTEDQAKAFLRIKLLQNFHIPLKEMQQRKRGRKIEDVLKNQIATLEKDIEEKQKEVLFLQTMQLFLMNNNDVSKRLHKETFGPCKLFGKIFHKADYDKVGDYISEVLSVADTLGLSYRKEHLVFYHNKEYLPKNATIEVALICVDDSGLELPKGYFVREYPATDCLVYDYYGPYDYFILLYQKLFKILEEKKILIEDFAFDYYVKSASSTNSPYDVFTKLCFPVNKTLSL